MEPKSGDWVNYLALADSYTIEESVAETERYSELLAKGLEGKGIKVELKK